MTTDAEADADALVDRLLAAGVLDEDPETGALATTESFEATRAVYHDTYGDADDDRFHRTVADLFGVPRDDAPAVVAEHGVTRDELVAYLAVRAELEGDATHDDLAAMTGVVLAAEPASPAPGRWPEVGDDAYREFLHDHPDAVLLVCKRDCAPCEAMKRDLDDIEAAAPDRVAFAGVDGERAEEVVRRFGVEAVPTTLVFAGGELIESVRGRARPETLADVFADAY